MKQKQTIIVCPQCKGIGKGYKINKDGTPYMVRGKPLIIPCDYCNGERVVMQRITIEHFLITPEIIEEEQKKEGFFKRWIKKES